MRVRDQFTCAGCGGVRIKVALGGAFILSGAKVSIAYLLCEGCAAQYITDRQRMLDRIEANLLEPQGAA